MNQDNVAILIFSRSPHDEALAKSFVGQNIRRNEAVARLLLHQTQRTAQLTGIPTFLIDSKHQHGQHFGERLANAIDQVVGKGFQKVLVIGNDCPALTPTRLREAAKQLRSHDIVLGSDHHGGVYLLGITATQVDVATLANLDWQTDSVFNQLVQCVQNQQLSYHQLPLLHDFNYATDLGLMRSSQQVSASLLAILSNFLTSTTTFSSFDIPLRHHQRFRVALSLPAPPVSICSDWAV